MLWAVCTHYLRSFISDIGAHSFRPVFIAGSVVTALSFAATAISLHRARYSPSFYDFAADKRWRKVLSITATVLALIASVSLAALSVFDTQRYHEVHKSLLLVTFAGLAGNAIATTLVWWNEGKVVWYGRAGDRQNEQQNRLQYW